MTAFGKYQVLELVGRGGFGSVFKGYDPTLKRHVAIKTCTLQRADVRERFVREAEIAASLKHPNIVTVYDFGEENGEPYLVQEFLPGYDLEDVIGAQMPLDMPTRIGYLSQIAVGLAFAHARGVVHRDVKPGNIRVLDDGTIRIMDFGIAKVLEIEHSVTQTGFVMGTAGYLAPEQIRGERIDSRADMFAFGVLAYMLVSYTRPFSADSVTAQCYQILYDEPLPIEQRVADCPPRLAEVIGRCLRKNREDRYASLTEVKLTLDRVLADLATPSGPGSGPLRETAGTPEVAQAPNEATATTAARAGRHRSMRYWALGAAATAVLLVLGAAALRPERRPGLHRIRASAQADAATQATVLPPAGDAEQGAIRDARDGMDEPRATASVPTAPARPSRAPTHPLPETGVPGPSAAANHLPAGASVTAGALVVPPNLEPPPQPSPVSRSRVLLFLRGQEDGLPSAEAAIFATFIEHELEVTEQEFSSRIVTDRSSADAVFSGRVPEISRYGREQGAGLVVVAELRAQAGPSVGGFYTGGASLTVRIYDSAAGRLLAAETFQVGGAGVPGKLGATSQAALIEAAAEVGRQAARTIVRHAGR